MKISEKEIQNLNEVLKKEIRDAKAELIKTNLEEQKKRKIIEEKESQYNSLLLEERVIFQKELERKFKNTSLHELNKLLSEAMLKNDQVAIEIILKRIGNM
ncbi:hypothetical protein OB971_22220 [Bacillus cereus]|uniref:hypothetical protein n=1 Tax=Bacillus tropicus TaxID=2026188 RepID=UPI0013D6FDE8|nr:hypothetical protein [Bacillus tropicus]MCU4797764.1 hypothetical protein [Bacillus cereus]